jgi:hypothetical protein
MPVVLGKQSQVQQVYYAVPIVIHTISYGSEVGLREKREIGQVDNQIAIEIRTVDLDMRQGILKEGVARQVPSQFKVLGTATSTRR